MDHTAVGPAELAAVVTHMREGVQIIDRSYRYVFLNDAAARHGQSTPQLLVGRTMMECYPGIEHTPMFALLRDCMEHRLARCMENEFRYPDGKRGYFELRFEPCDAGLLILSIDVSEGRRLEAQLRQAQKMEAVGRLAGSVAHDFNNALSVILSFSSMLIDDLPPNDAMLADLQAIKRAGERAADLTRQLLAFSRQQVLAPRVVDLNRILRDGDKTLRRLVGEDVDIELRLQREPAQVLIDPGHVDQVIMNLVINARDAMPDGGKLVLETESVALDETYVKEHLGVQPGAYVMLGVSDNGVGMDRETQNQIFEPFFTTKEAGRGTGLGLSTVFGIVKQSGGHIWVYSEPGRGTTFKVYLPSADPAQPSEVAAVTPAQELAGHETVLVVEDQDDVRAVAREVLRRHGYHVLEARNAGEALLACERHPLPIHLMLTDVVMPQMGGRELAQRVASTRPEMRVIFMSGYTENGVVHHAILDPGIAYLQKPIIPDQLARQVRLVLGAQLPSASRTSASQ